MAQGGDYRSRWLITERKAIASAVNVAIVFVFTSPVYYYWGLNIWRASCITLFFLYTLALSRRCFGQVVARTWTRTHQSSATNVTFAALYTASMATLIFWLWLPLDLAFVNGLGLQLPCLLLRGNTVHGLLAGKQTMTEQEHLWECIALKGECPDCEKAALVRKGSYVHCRLCRSHFFAADLSVQRVAAA